MRFHIGKPPATPNFTPQEDGWTLLKEPSPMGLNLIATPIGVLAAVLIAMGWGSTSFSFTFGSSIFGHFAPVVYLLLIVVVGLPVLIAVHEFTHTLGYPNFGFTASTMIGFWPSKLLFLAMHFDALRRNRLLLVYLLPLTVISLVPLVLCRSLGIKSGFLMLASIVNGLTSGGDIFLFFLTLAQVPANALVRNQGWTTWWKRVG